MGTVFVTGAASGIGRAVVDVFSRKGWTAVAADLDAERLAHVWSGRDGVVARSCDVRDPVSVDSALASAGITSLDACVNVAGIYPKAKLRDFTPEIYRAIFDVNVLGILVVSRAALPYLEKGTDPAIVNFASIGAFQGGASDLALYRASKAAVVSLTRSMAGELAPDIRVNGIAPGIVATEGTKGSTRRQEIGDTVPLARLGRPEDMAAWTWALAGKAALPYATGETVIVSGGAYMA